MFDLTGKIAIVIGSSGRLGPIWIKALQSAGAGITTGDLSEGFDIRTRAAAPMLAKCAPDILVLNAGVDSRPSSKDYDAMTADMCDVNLRGVDYILRDIGGAMAKRGSGSIINIASLYGLVAPDLRYYDHRPDGWVKDSMYGATKAGVISLTKYYAAKYGKYGVRVNALAPGGVVADGDGLTAQDPEFVQKYTNRIPMGRMCKPEDLAGPLVFLASNASSFVNGQTIALDGGYLCW